MHMNRTSDAESGIESDKGQNSSLVSGFRRLMDLPARLTLAIMSFYCCQQLWALRQDFVSQEEASTNTHSFFSEV